MTRAVAVAHAQDNGNVIDGWYYDDGSADLRSARLTIARGALTWDISDNEELWDGIQWIPQFPNSVGATPDVFSGYAKGAESLITSCNNTVSVKYTAMEIDSNNVWHCSSGSGVGGGDAWLVGAQRCGGSNGEWCAQFKGIDQMDHVVESGQNNVQYAHVDEETWCDPSNPGGACHHLTSAAVMRASHGYGGSGTGDTNWQVSTQGQSGGGGWFVVPVGALTKEEFIKSGFSFRVCESGSDSDVQEVDDYTTTSFWDIRWYDNGSHPEC